MSNYWQRREAEHLAKMLKDEKQYEKELQRIYKDMLASAQKEIDAFYGRYAEKEGITLATAKKRVSKLDIEAYERKAEKYVKNKTFTKKANEEMRLYNATMRINRLEMLKANIGLELIKGHAELDDFMKGILKGRTVEELERQAGILGKTIKNNAKLADSIVNGSYQNATFSERLWGYQSQLKADLGKALEQGMIAGKNARTLTKDIQKYFIGTDGKGGASYYAERLMRTELARVQTDAQKKSFEKNGFTKYRFIVNSGCCDLCQEIAKKKDGIYDVDKMMPGENAPPVHPFCRCSTAAYEDSAEYDAWLEYLEKGGTTEQWNKMSKAEKMAWLRKQRAEELKQRRRETPAIRQLPDIEFEEAIHGINEANPKAKLEKIDNDRFILKLDKRETVEWDSIPDNCKKRIQWFAPQRNQQPFFIDKGEHDVRPYVKNSSEFKKREELAKKLGGDYIGTAHIRKYNSLWDVDIYTQNGKIVYSFGKAELKKTLTEKSFENVKKIAREREKIIGEKLREKGISFRQLKARRGDDWVETMKEFHRIIAADGKPRVLSDAEYDAIKGDILYRGIAPSSHLRKDITNTRTPKEMADGFFIDDKPFPSRGIYGDGIAYCSPSLERIGGQYATANWTIDKGGKIIEFKIDPDAKTISYDDALELFQTMVKKDEGNLLFNGNQRGSLKGEVGKAMNAMGYDVIIEEDGDGTGVPFYVILNRGCLVTKENWTTLTVTPEWFRKIRGRRW